VSARRIPALILSLVVATILGTTLVACGGDDSSSGSSSDALHGIKVSGDVGKAPKVDWDGQLDVSSTQTAVLTEGDGEEVADGDRVQVNLWIGNGYDQKQVYSTYEQGQPQSLTVDDQLLKPLKEALVGQKIGSRVAVTAVADDVWGDTGNPSMGISNKDSVLFLVDLMDKTTVLDGPQGKEQPAPAWAPEVRTDGDQVTGLDFSGVKKSKALASAALVKGTGATVKKGQTITVDYFGEVYGGKKPFDESYSGDPASFAIGTGQVIPGWDKTLVGAKVGSRMILAIPPADGYGSQKSGDIPPNSTLYFVVDILSAS
jgi:peptidylprolyl isomerase